MTLVANKNKKPFRVGMVGAGFMAKLHSLSMNNIAGLTNDPDAKFDLIRIVDIHAASAKKEAKRWGWKESGTDWKTVTRDASIDIVDIATPNDSHCEICLDAFANGKHVICEKPLSTDSKTAELMARKAVESGKIHMVNFTYRAWPAIAQTKKIIESGAIGQIHHFEGHFLQDHNNDPTIPLHWRFQKGPAGAGALGDVGAHIIDLARFLVGEFDSVSATMQRFIDERPLVEERTKKGAVEVDDFTSALIKFQNGATGTIKAGWALPGYKNDVFFAVIGEKGSIRFSWERSNELQYFDSSDPSDLSGYRTILLGRVHPGAELFWFPDLGGESGMGVTAQGMGYGEAFALSFNHFVDSLKSGKSASPNFIDGLRCCEIIDAIKISAEKEAWQKVHLAKI
ncbi:Gfo/Idh/MocA family oxidoreductase [Xenorhabdus bovienii]|uniref:Gfo/Idh/MocA family protein n=1 Tax=Xenorhabdus bovienii TaxID=40576 RepID=UPI00237C8D07|nr:Gfo/Idh/MocA family oxidoreductase [Xenorhabdus bovienii]MDE1485485.1 Gfo/Idh/MocA family oxidoreductase [Xenorhabdus bovienii]MDE9479234.1 Gfo/Idh/MocA family oxidoreductase [Xenorhabdus bovienii]MDE9531109.1 Gfo/Idh/MocA family oxidoreductase [Xenorhabdus bovienii]